MPTIAGMRRRGVTPEAIRSFLEMVGVAKADSRVDLGKLEYAIRDHLNWTVPRVMAVLRPLKVVITNYLEGEEELEIPSYPHDVPLEGSRPVPFSREIYIEREDFMEDPPGDFFRLAPGREVRLRYAYFIRCEEAVKDPASGEVVELRCTYDPETRGGTAPDGRNVKGTIHWVSAGHALPAEVRLYDRLFSRPDPEEAEEGEDLTDHLNPESAVVLDGAWIEPSVAADPAATRYQFERMGYFISDAEDSRPGSLVFNRIVTLRDTWKGRMEGDVRLSVTPESKTTFEPAPTSLPAQGEDPKGNGEPQGAGPAKSKRERRNTGQEARDRTRLQHPELAERRTRYSEEWDLPADDADLLSGSVEVSDFFEEAVALHGNASALANWIVNEVLPEARGRPLADLPVTAEGLADLVSLLDDETISHPVAKEVFAEMVGSGAEPRALVKDRGLERLGDPELLAPLVDKILEAFPGKVEEYRGGKTGLLGFFTGQVMRKAEVGPILGRSGDPPRTVGMTNAPNRSLKKGGAAAHRGVRRGSARRSRGRATRPGEPEGRSAVDARQGRTTNAMQKYRRGVLTQRGATTPLCPEGYGGTGPSASLALLYVPLGYAIEASPGIWPRGARDAVRPPFFSDLFDPLE